MGIKKFIKEKIFFLVEDFPIDEKEDYSEFKEDVFKNIKIRWVIESLFLLNIPIFVYVFGLSADLLKAEAAMFWIIIYTTISFFIIRKNYFKTYESLSNFYLIFLVLDLVWLAIFVHYYGGLSWMGMLIFIFYLNSYLAFAKYKQCFIITLAVIISSLAVGLIDYFKILPSIQVFNQGGILQTNLSFLYTTYSSLLLTFYFAAYWNFSFSWKLRESKTNLRKERAGLEEKVKERTQELEKEKVSLAEKVKERTAEIEISKNNLLKSNRELGEANENLERMNKLMMGRELKMIELKKEIEELKNKS